MISGHGGDCDAICRHYRRVHWHRLVGRGFRVFGSVRKEADAPHHRQAPRPVAAGRLARRDRLPARVGGIAISRSERMLEVVAR
jgi:hypothetical protein